MAEFSLCIARIVKLKVIANFIYRMPGQLRSVDDLPPPVDVRQMTAFDWSKLGSHGSEESMAQI